MATLLFDLLTPAEESDRANVFDIELLGRRLEEVTRAVVGEAEFGEIPVGFFGASTGAAAALYAAATPETNVAAVVSRGGRPDLAGSHLGAVRSPTLLIVGGRDDQVLELNELARRQLRCESDLVVVPGATHLFEEPGTLEPPPSTPETGSCATSDDAKQQSGDERGVRSRRREPRRWRRPSR